MNKIPSTDEFDKAVLDSLERLLLAVKLRERKACAGAVQFVAGMHDDDAIKSALAEAAKQIEARL